jgi:hypothetical protein
LILSKRKSGEKVIASSESYQLVDLFKRLSGAIAANPNMSMGKMRAVFEHLGDATAEPRGVDASENTAGGGFAVDLQGSQFINALVFGKTQEELKVNLEKNLRRAFFQRHFDARTLLRTLKESKPDAEAVFLPSQAGPFPMQFYRFKSRGFNLDTIELNGADLKIDEPRHEFDRASAITVGYFLQYLSDFAAMDRTRDKLLQTGNRRHALLERGYSWGLLSP